jgi:hypothetical protein
MEELCRRVTGIELGEYYDQTLRGPYEIDCFLGLPEHEEGRYQEVLFEENFDKVAEGVGPVDSMLRMAGNSRGPSPLVLPNIRRIRTAGPASVGAVASASGLARGYAAAVTGLEGRQPLISARTVDIVSAEQVFGLDRVLSSRASYLRRLPSSS